jgi:CHAT domain-containing protein
VSTVLANLAMLYAVHGNAKRAISVLTDGSDARDRNLQLTLATGSEEQKRLYMASIADGTSTIVSLHLRFAANDVEAAHLALTTILRRKGRVLDVMSGQIAALGNHRDIVSEAVLTKLAGVRGQLSSLVLRGPGDDAALYSTTMEGLQAQIQALEKTVSERATASEASAPLVSIEGVQAAIPVNAALVELIQYRPLLSNRSSVPHWDVPRYAAYVLKHSGPPAWVDLGDAVRIDLAAMHFLTALRTHASLISSARTLDDEVMRPVRKLLGNVRQVLISPDGELNLVPFAALIDERNQYLVENYTLTYLTSGRDLLRLGTHLPSRQGPVVIANPLFETPARDTPLLSELERNSARDTGRSADFGERFMPLQETSEEAREVSSILTGAKVYTGAQATEALVKQLTAPSILHIATHGFFLGKPVVRNAASTGAGRGSNLSAHSLLAENPLLRSGIALSGANELNDGQGQDGVLTALEAAGLDLHGTKLVVLSACETGVGDVQTGEGVYGLRRALVLAGAESEIISLWKVDDDATRDLMVEFYKKLQSGISRAEALRQVQLKLLKSADHNQPFFWAPFILSGDWGTLAAAP